MMNFEQWKTTGAYFQYQDRYPIFYQTAGKGPVLLCLHGFPTASWDWHKIWQPLAKHFQLLAFDFIGFGYSAKPRSYDYSIIDQANLAEALLSHHGIQEYHILAHDYGDTVAQELLARHYEHSSSDHHPQLLSLAMLNGGIFPSHHHARLIQRALASPVGIIFTPFLNRSKLQSNFNAIFGPDTQASEQEIDEFYQLMEINNGKYRFHRLIRYIHERRIYEDRWRAATLKGVLPQCLINGAVDPISGKHVAVHYQQVVNNPQVAVLENIGHYPQTEAPEAVLEAYWNFWNSFN